MSAISLMVSPVAALGSRFRFHGSNSVVVYEPYDGWHTCTTMLAVAKVYNNIVCT